MKRALDLVGASFLLAISSPLLIVVGIAIRITLGRPILFKQRRLGYQGKEFTLLKFRTMHPASDDSDSDEDRLTKFGSRIRSLSLDELPELINVLKGDMSLVGPRPLLVEYREEYSPRQWRRHEVLPGLVGPVTAYGRNALSWPDKFELDVWYVESWSLLLDLKLMAVSFWKAVGRKGISAEDHVTMPRFRRDDQ